MNNLHTFGGTFQHISHRLQHQLPKSEAEPSEESVLHFQWPPWVQLSLNQWGWTILFYLFGLFLLCSFTQNWDPRCSEQALALTSHTLSEERCRTNLFPPVDMIGLGSSVCHLRKSVSRSLWLLFSTPPLTSSDNEHEGVRTAPAAETQGQGTFYLVC